MLKLEEKLIGQQDIFSIVRKFNVQFLCFQFILLTLKAQHLLHQN